MMRTTTVACVIALALAGCLSEPDVDPTTSDSTIVNVPPPFHTDGRWIVDSNGKRVKLAALNWVGFASANYVPQGLERAPLAVMVHTMRTMGFNAVRLSWSNQLWEQNPPACSAQRTSDCIAAKLLAANPALQGLDARALFAAVIAELTAQKLYVILDDHSNTAGDCCGAENPLWWDGFTWLEDHDNFEAMNARWQRDWFEVVDAYKGNPYVIGVDLFNEPRGPACWACSDREHDWHHAAQALGNKIVARNPNLLIIVEGLQKRDEKLQGVKDAPIELTTPHRLVYSAHNYGNGHYERHPDLPCDHPGPEVQPENPNAKSDFFHMMKEQFGFILDGGKRYTAPVWIGEFGREHVEVNTTCKYQDVWWTYFTAYLEHRDMDWSYFGATGPYYGVIDPTSWQSGTEVLAPYSAWLLAQLQALEAPKRGSKVDVVTTDDETLP